MDAKSSEASRQGITALSRRYSIGANDRIHVGVIGCGLRGRGDLMTAIHRWDKALNVEIIAVCDVWRQRREEAAAIVKDWYGREPRQCVSYREVMDMPEVDAVVIASPDHVHTLHLEAAAQAGKHAYCEKPLAKDMDGLRRAVDAVREAGIIVQVGTQWRSLPAMTGARDVIRAGTLETIARIEQYFNDPRPYWYPRLKEAREEDVDWSEFLYDRPARPFDPWVFTGWMGHREFSDGAVPGYGSHFIDLVQYFTGAGAPESCVCLGGVYVWRDKYNFTSPDTVQAVWQYQEGFQVTYSTCFCNDSGDTFRIFGNTAMMNLDDWFRFGADPAFYLTTAGAGAPDGRKENQVPVQPVDRPDHMRNWLECLRNGKTPHANIDDGYNHSVAVIMAMEAYDRGCQVKYDPVHRSLYTD